MPKSNSPTILSREQFLEEASRMLARVQRELAGLHGEPPCLFAVDIETVTAWSELQREQTLAALRDAVSRAEELVHAAEAERTVLWEGSEASPEDKTLPPIVALKQLREDLQAYESVLQFVRSRTS
jgi:hypothetical protein